MTFTNKDLATSIIATVLYELSNRRGFHGFWDEIDEDIQEELTETLREKVENELTSAFSGV